MSEIPDPVYIGSIQHEEDDHNDCRNISFSILSNVSGWVIIFCPYTEYVVCSTVHR